LGLKGPRCKAERAVSRGHTTPPTVGEGPNGRESDSTTSLDGARRQMFRQLELALETQGEALAGQRSGEAPAATQGAERSGTDHLME